MQVEREVAFKKNQKLEALLREINTILEPAEGEILGSFHMPRYPVIFIIGCARAGSTLILQWLARSNEFAYPTNLLARFYGAPYIGARIQQLLTDPVFNFRDEFLDLTPVVNFSSALGKTRGILAPNEFWYFWRRFFHFGEIQQLDEAELQRVDVLKFTAELAALEAAFDKPLALKGHIINWNIPFVAKTLKKALFIHIVRQPLQNAQSLLESRKKFFGTIEEWYSFKPPEYAYLKERNPYEQVAGQVYFTNEAIRRGLEQINSDCWMRVPYEEFCNAPARVFSTIKDKFINQECMVEWNYMGPEAFECTNQIRLAEDEVRQVMDAYTTFVQGDRRR